MKFLQTADWQIGMKAEHVGKAGGRVREERVSAVKRVVDVAQKNSVDLVLVAGDTFENNGVDRVQVQKVADVLASVSVPIFLIPGNHDPLTPGSVWEHPVWKSTQNVRVLRDECPVKVPDGLLYPCPVTEKQSDKDPTAWIRANETQRIHVGLAHGTVEGIHQEEPDHPIARDAASRGGLDYLALGHWHSTATYPGPDNSVRMAYSGTHETTKFGERDSGNVLVVEIASPGALPIITPIHTSGLEWEVIEQDLREPGNLPRVREQIESIDNPGSALVDLRISGLLAAQDRGEIARIQEIVASRFLFGRVDVSQIRPSPEDENWVSELPAGIIREAGIKLRELADPAYVGERPEGASPETASRALLELYAMVTEVTQ